MNLIGYGKKHRFYSALSIDECVQILNATGTFGSSIGIRARVNGSRFTLSRKTDPSTSAYNPVFYGSLVDSGGGTVVEGHFGLSRFSMLITFLLYLWMAAMPLFLMSSESVLRRVGIAALVLGFTSLITLANLAWGKLKMKPLLVLIQHDLRASSTYTVRGHN
jgi:hypothetical protein